MRIQTFAAAVVVAGAVAFSVLMPVNDPPAAAQTSVAIDVHELARRDHLLRNWDTVCTPHTELGRDATNGAATVEHCHLQFVDLIDTADPQAGFVAAFVVADNSGLRVEFDIDSERVDEIDVSLMRNGHAVWSLTHYECRRAGTCIFSGPAAEALVKAFSDSVGHTLEMHIDFVNPEGQQLNHTWPMWSFAPAYSDFRTIHQPVGM